MIHQSRHWKEPLLRAATWMSRIQIDDDEAGEKSLVRVEREMFIGFYAIRKLLETFKVSKTTKELKVDLLTFQPQPDKLVDYFNKNDIDDLFDLDQPAKEQRDIGFLCNQLIHSYVFVISIEKAKLHGFFFASDSMRAKKLYFVDLASVVRVFRTVGKDYPDKMIYRRNDKTAQWEVHDA